MSKIYVITKRPTTTGVDHVEGRAFPTEMQAMDYTAKMSQASNGAVIYGWWVVELYPRPQIARSK